MKNNLVYIWLGLLSLAILGVFLKMNENKLGNTTKPNVTNPSENIISDGISYKIAFVNTDSLVSKYEYHKGLREKLEIKFRSMERELERRSKVFQENYQVLEQQAANLSDAELQMAQAELMQKQQELIAYRDQQAESLSSEEAELTKLLLQDLDSVLVNIQAEQNLDFIFSMNAASFLLKANNAYDITPSIVSRLNTAHEKRKAKQ
jgi:outer membrane protein